MLEYFFISSPVGALKIGLKQNKLYFVGKVNACPIHKLKKSKSQGLQTVSNRNFFSAKQLSRKIRDKNLSYIVDERSPAVIRKQKLSFSAQNVKHQLQAYFNKELKRFNISLCARGTTFQRKVWRAMRKIPWGQSKTYSQLARELKNPRAVRAIGNSCARNPFLIVVPCHRVTAQKGLGGFALGLRAKRQLIALEK